MAPTLSRTLGWCEREETPTSILAAGQDEFHLADDWNEIPDKCSAWRNSSPDRRPFTASSRWSLRLSSLSSSVIGAGAALTTRAKQLGVGESTQRAISQLRKSMIEVSSRTERSLRDAQHRFSEADIDRFDDRSEQPESEEAGDEEPDEEAQEEGKFKRLHASRLWTQWCT
ncbi:hypothetical protein PHYPSEUDO_015416 [Phytophthora pseudosyringae]|uniref:Uncharacterized protein n=1 Tax=Phytophthora pseudosyringae TaxID=221518 RepID=A0A8T1VYR5_9STRA|nr:hypothetical protein PHYPSEUDO_015416 [Phytophthora pseudosyringae]